MSEAMGRDIAAVREEVRECRIGVWEEMRESEARLMGEIGNMTKEVEGLTIGQNELKEQMEKNTGNKGVMSRREGNNKRDDCN